MKTKLFYLILALPILLLILTSSSGGYTSAASGSPGDFQITCASCHSGGNFSAVAAITTNIPTSGYQLNTIYNVTVSVASSSSKHGFQLTAENNSNAKVGTFVAGSDSQTFNSNKSVTHRSAGTSKKSWTVQWTSPSTNQGEVTFYAAVNATNGNNNFNGDQAVTTFSKTNSEMNLGVSDYLASQFSYAPNPADDQLNFEIPLGVEQAEVIFYNHLGQNMFSQKISTNQKSVDLSSLISGVYMMNVKTNQGTFTKSIVVK